YTRVPCASVTLFRSFSCSRLPPRTPPFPYTTLFRSFWNGTITMPRDSRKPAKASNSSGGSSRSATVITVPMCRFAHAPPRSQLRSEEHTSELQSRFDLVCRLLLETKKLSQLQSAIQS